MLPTSSGLPHRSLSCQGGLKGLRRKAVSGPRSFGCANHAPRSHAVCEERAWTETCATESPKVQMQHNIKMETQVTSLLLTQAVAESVYHRWESAEPRNVFVPFRQMSAFSCTPSACGGRHVAHKQYTASINSYQSFDVYSSLSAVRIYLSILEGISTRPNIFDTRRVRDSDWNDPRQYLSLLGTKKQERYKPNRKGENTSCHFWLRECFPFVAVVLPVG